MYQILTALMAERYLVYGRSGVQIPDRSNFTQRCKRFATASTST